mgnify:CR=1 FL=1
MDNKPRRSRGKKTVVQEVKTTTIQVKVNREIEEDKLEQQVLEVHEFQTTPAMVEVKAGMTKAIGQFEFLRVDVGITRPCYTEEIEEVQGEVAIKVANALNDELDNYLGEQ